MPLHLFRLPALFAAFQIATLRLWSRNILSWTLHDLCDGRRYADTILLTKMCNGQKKTHFNSLFLLNFRFRNNGVKFHKAWGCFCFNVESRVLKSGASSCAGDNGGVSSVAAGFTLVRQPRPSTGSAWTCSQTPTTNCCSRAFGHIGPPTKSSRRRVLSWKSLD